MALRHQLAVYQHTVKRRTLRPADRLFWSWLARLWFGLAFVQPRTAIAWQKRRFRDYWRQRSQSGRPGRPALSKDVRDLIRDMWCANPLWGAPRIVGELRKLGLTVAKSTVEKYRPRVRKPSSPTWQAFLKNHVTDIVACDFFTVPTASFKVLFVFIMLAHERRVAYLGAADNSRGPLLSRLKGTHQSVIKPRQSVFSFSFIPPCRLGDRPILFYCTPIVLENALPRLSLWPRRHPVEQHFFE